jgi:DNA-binding MarR family transcriptional regulator
MNDEDVFEVQRFYPRIYLACHVDHVRAASTSFRISAQDASILSHLDREMAQSPRELASHLGVAASTLSATIARLSRLGYITSTPTPADQRRRELRLTAAGAEAGASTSVLDAGRVQLLPNTLTPAERKDAVRGLALLAAGARRLKEQNP